MSQPVRAHPPPTHHQSALIRTVSPSSSAHALRASRDLQRIPAIRHHHGSGVIDSGDCFRRGIIQTTTAVTLRSQHDRLTSGLPRHPLRQQGKYRALPFGSRPAPFADLGDGATAARAKPGARIERADRNAG